MIVGENLRAVLVNELYDAFWKACRDSDDPLGYYELPPSIFGKLADAAIAILQDEEAS